MVDNISLEVELGKIYGILGANGSGKPTLIRLIPILLLPVSGSITVFGYSVFYVFYLGEKYAKRVRQLKRRG